MTIDRFRERGGDDATDIACIHVARARGAERAVELAGRFDRGRGPEEVLHKEGRLHERERQAARHHQLLCLAMLPAEEKRRRRVRADRGELHQVPDAHLLRRLNEARFALDEALVDRREQQAPLRTVERGTQRLRLVEVSGDDLRAGLRQIDRFGRTLDHRAHCGTRAE
jgi:hypothetical protein